MNDPNPAHWPIHRAIVAHVTAAETLLSRFPASGFAGTQAELLEIRGAWWGTVAAVELQLYRLANGVGAEDAIAEDAPLEQAETDFGIGGTGFLDPETRVWIPYSQAVYIRHWTGVPHGVGADGK